MSFVGTDALAVMLHMCTWPLRVSLVGLSSQQVTSWIVSFSSFLPTCISYVNSRHMCRINVSKHHYVQEQHGYYWYSKALLDYPLCSVTRLNLWALVECESIMSIEQQFLFWAKKSIVSEPKHLVVPCDFLWSEWITAETGQTPLNNCPSKT